MVTVENILKASTEQRKKIEYYEKNSLGAKSPRLTALYKHSSIKFLRSYRKLCGKYAFFIAFAAWLCC